MFDRRLANSPIIRLARRTFVRPLVERRLNPGHQISGSDYTVTVHDAAANLLPIRALRRDLMAQRRKDSNWDDFVNYLHAATEPVSLVNDVGLWAPIPLVTAHAPQTCFDNLRAALRHAREGQKGIILEGRRGSGKTGLLEKCWFDSLLASADRGPPIPIWLPWGDFGKRTSQPQTSAHAFPMPPESLALTQLL
jgi:hypothetical protein